MTSGEPLNSGDENDARRQMLQSVEQAVHNEDYDFMLAVTDQQELLRPFEIVEWMDVKRRGAEDPVEERRWSDGLYRYFASLDGQRFPDDETEAMQSVANRLQFDNITSNEAVAEEPYEENSKSNEDADNWENDEFGVVGLSNEEIKAIRATVVFTQVEAKATYAYGSAASNLGGALGILHKNVEGEARSRMHKVLDWFVFHSADAAATYAYGSSESNLEKAHGLINNFGSDEDTKALMKAALDKRVFQSATAAANYAYGSTASNISKAKSLIEKYASSPARRDAMFRRLGFL